MPIINDQSKKNLRNLQIEKAKVTEMRLFKAKTNALKRYRPYPKQIEFHNKGLTDRERLFMAGNQLGKTMAGASEVAIHLTGLYPESWEGLRFDRPTKWWAASVTGEATRDNPQRMLIGDAEHPEQWGTAAIPLDCIGTITKMRHGVANAIDTVLVKHVSGGWSSLGFKNYAQGREKWQGPTIDGVWNDEEPPVDVYMEGLTRTNKTEGPVITTFTPLQGMSEVVERFLIEEPEGTSVSKMGIYDAEHYTKEQADRIIASYPAHERKARAFGNPILGSGKVFPIDEDDIKIAAFDIPEHWPLLGALDFGWDHPTAAVKLAWDRDSDIVYVTACYRKAKETPLFHTASLKGWGNKLPFSWPHDGLQHDKGSGEQLKEIYKSHGLHMLPERSQFEDGSSGLEAGTMDLLERMQTKRFYVFSHLEDWFSEFRMYHRKDGLIVKKKDDVMSATRYGTMDLRHAKVQRKRSTPLKRREIGMIA